MKRIHGMMNILSLLFLFLFMARPLWATGPIMANNITRSPIGFDLEYLVDRDATLTVDDLTAPGARHKWIRSHQSNLNFGFTESVYWVRFSTATTLSKTRNLLMEIAYPLLDSINVYIFKDKKLEQKYMVGDSLPFRNRPIAHTNFLLPLNVFPGHVTQVILRVQSRGSVQIPIVLWSQESFIEKDHAESLAYGIFFGAIFALAFYHLLLFLSLRDIGFFYYSMFMISVLSSFACIKGFMFSFIFPEDSAINDILLVVSICAGVFSSILFTQSVLIMREARPRLAIVLRIIAYTSAAIAAGALFLPYNVMIRAAIMIGLVSVVINMTVHVIRMLDGYLPARYIVLAGAFSAAGIMVMFLGKLGILPLNAVIDNASYGGIFCMSVLYSLTLSQRMNMDRRLREDAQLKTAETQREFLETQIKQNEELDRLVRERTEELEAINVKLQELSVTDALTKLRNRRYFDEFFTLEYKRAYRDKKPISVLLFDIDHFKNTNDTYGHHFGDLCLVLTGELIKNNIKRPPDIAARYGGEEFIVLLPNTDLEGAIQVARWIHRDFNDTIVEDGDVAVKITVSIGVASIVPDGNTNQEILLKKADSLLYQAKENGRNRIEWETRESAR